MNELVEVGVGASPTSAEQAGASVGDGPRGLLMATSTRLEQMSSVADGAGMNVRMAGAMLGELLRGIHDMWSNSNAPERQANEAKERDEQASALLEQAHAIAKDIGNVVALVDSIAYTTRVLAVNAAIQAAHAGDAGRGFAIVAEEVRSLSRDTLTATLEIHSKMELLASTTLRASGAIDGTRENVARIHVMVKSVTEGVVQQAEMTKTVQGYMTEAADSVSGLGQVAEDANRDVKRAEEGIRTLLGVVAGVAGSREFREDRSGGV
jgi:methyl-accepting chemotaxis protein